MFELRFYFGTSKQDFNVMCWPSSGWTLHLLQISYIQLGCKEYNYVIGSFFFFHETCDVC